MSRFVLAVVTLIGMSTAVAQPKAKPRGLEGTYTCQFELKGSPIGPLAEQPCAISVDDKKGASLVMTGGPKRIRGTVTATAKGFDFDGAFECPDASCDEKTKGSFVRNGTGFVGALPSNGKTITVTIAPAK